MVMRSTTRSANAGGEATGSLQGLCGAVRFSSVDRGPYIKQRASEVDSQPVGRRRLHVSSFQEAPLLAQKAASRSCLRKCLRIFTDNHTPHLTDREPSHSLARHCGCIFRPRPAVHPLSKKHPISQTNQTRTSEPASFSSSSGARSVGDSKCASRSCQAVCDARIKKNLRIDDRCAGHIP